MSEDSLLQEVRAAREEYASMHGFDVQRIVADLQKLNNAGDWPVTRLEPRKPQRPGATADGRNQALQHSFPE